MNVSVNYLAILACGVAAIIIGFLWYGPLFGKQWMKLAGIDKATPEEMEKGKKEMPKMAAIQFVGALLMAWVLTYVIVFMNAYLTCRARLKAHARRFGAGSGSSLR